MSKSSRYYSQQYSRLDDPWDPSASSFNLEDQHQFADDRPLAYDAGHVLASDPIVNGSHNPLKAPRGWSGAGSSSGGRNFLDSAKDWWRRQTQRTKYIIYGSVAAFIILLIIIIAVAASVASSESFSYTPSDVRVTNRRAFLTGGATHKNSSDVTNGIGAGKDVYVYYEGSASNFPSAATWVSFEDMWNANLETLQTSCGILGYGSDNTDEINDQIYYAIQNRSAVSLVDHRYIFATILQESKGCVHVKSTTSQSGVSNPGLMQSHNGQSYSSSHSAESIMAMVQDGTQGTEAGDGLVQNLNIYGDPYSASRGYNSGYIPKSGDLSQAAGATACYVSDVANRLTGWVKAKSLCPGDTTISG